MDDFTTLSREDLLDRLSHTQDLLDAALGSITALQEQNAALAARVKQLEDRLGKDSHNSSKPPSSDGLRKKPKSLRGNSDRKSGGQRGHPGRTLPFTDTPDQVVVHRPQLCQACGGSLAQAQEVDTQRRQVIDLPPLSLIVTEHQAKICCCPECGHSTRADFPEEAKGPVQYGPNVKALATYLSGFQLLPMDRICMLMTDLFGVRISEGTLHNATEEAASVLKTVETSIRAALRSAASAHFDETGLRVNGTLNWLHVTSTPNLTFYHMHSHRGQAALNETLFEFTGRAIHDGWPAYFMYNC